MAAEPAGETRQGKEKVTETEIFEKETTSIETENTATGEGSQITNGPARETLDLLPVRGILHSESVASVHLVAAIGPRGAEIAAQLEGAEVSSGSNVTFASLALRII